jgi:esterase/lipase superfamily enzyme
MISGWSSVFENRGTIMNSVVGPGSRSWTCAGQTGFLSLLILALASLECNAASILTQQMLLATESPEPNRATADRLEVAVLLNPDERGVVLQAQPFAAAGVTDKLAPVKSKDKPEHFVTYETKVARPEAERIGEPAIVRATLELDLKQLNLPNGEYRLAYELRLIRDGKIDFSRPTAVSQLSISPRDPSRIRTINTIVEHFVPDKSVRKGYALVGAETSELDVEYAVLKPVYETKTLATITGGVQRSGKFQALPTAPLSDFEPKQKRLVYFATNRRDLGARLPPDRRFDTERSDAITYGDCLVNIPITNHVRGKLELSSWPWQSDDPKRYFAIEALAAMEKSDWRQALKDEDTLLYVHGYNTTFPFAILRAAQLKHDLQFGGEVVVFSWPSLGDIKGYVHDENENAASIDALGTVLRTLTERQNGKNVHVICHSMGNRVFIKAVRQLVANSQWESSKKHIGHVILAAADVAPNEFGSYVPTLIDVADSVTFYFSIKDRALEASRVAHLNNPAGAGFFYAKGMETVDASLVDLGVFDMGHGYFASDDPLLTDEQLLILFNRSAAKRRPPLTIQKLYQTFPFWGFEVPAMAPGPYK